VFLVNVVSIKMMKLLPRHHIDHHLFNMFPLFYQIHFPLRSFLRSLALVCVRFWKFYQMARRFVLLFRYQAKKYPYFIYALYFQ